MLLKKGRLFKEQTFSKESVLLTSKEDPGSFFMSPSALPWIKGIFWFHSNHLYKYLFSLAFAPGEMARATSTPLFTEWNPEQFLF